MMPVYIELDEVVRWKGKKLTDLFHALKFQIKKKMNYYIFRPLKLFSKTIDISIITDSYVQ